jgi:hypothetical protein
MTRAQLDSIVAAHGLTVDGSRGGSGKFADLEIGVGALPATLATLQCALVDAGIGCRTVLTTVDNREHPQYGDLFLWVRSFWNE